ncbi:hypothetical protein INT46_001989, partial [Mucor plumbeus]
HGWLDFLHLTPPADVREDIGTGPRNWALDFVSESGAPTPVKILSYADDLEVFYHPRTSGLLCKSVLVSLSGVSHSAWISLANTTGL